MNRNLKWEYLVNECDPIMGGEVIRRAVVPGGWLVQATTIIGRQEGEEAIFGESMVFVPNTGEEWTIEDQADKGEEFFEKLAGLKRVYN